jgi:hypothetical protein
LRHRVRSMGLSMKPSHLGPDLTAQTAKLRRLGCGSSTSSGSPRSPLRGALWQSGTWIVVSGRGLQRERSAACQTSSVATTGSGVDRTSAVGELPGGPRALEQGTARTVSPSAGRGRRSCGHLPDPARRHEGFAGVPRWAGLRSENAAHRVAVEWTDPQGITRTGVYIPRRDSNSWTNVALGGRLYPGEHHRARFHVYETDESIRVAYTAADGTTDVDVAVRLTQQLAGSALFATLHEASAFFEAGSVGYSATGLTAQFDGLQLQTAAWKVAPATVKHAHSSFFEDRLAFPPGTAQLDSALIMRKVPVDWLPLRRLNAAPADG